MKSIEKSAKTYEEALESALKDLNASISDVDVLTLEEGSKGLFGLFGSRPYKIRVTLKNSASDEDTELDVMSLLAPKKPEPKPERKPEPRPERKPEKKPEAEKSEEKAAEKKPARRPEPVRRVNPERKPADDTAEETAAAAEPVTAVSEPEAAQEETSAESAERRKPRRRRHRGKGGSRKPEDRAETAETAEEGEEGEKPAKKLPPKPAVKPVEKPVVTMLDPETIDPESGAGKAKAFLQELTRLMGVDVTIEMGLDQENNVFGYISGDPLGILIGRRGETLDALQYLTSLRVNRGQDTYTRVTLDTENYRAKREDTLIRLANRKANHAIKTGRRVALDPMNPYERRIIHGALQANEAVETHSEGEEPGRHVVITVRKA